MIDLSELRTDYLVGQGLSRVEDAYYYEFGRGEYCALESLNGAASYYFGSEAPDHIAHLVVGVHLDASEKALLERLFGELPYLPGAKPSEEELRLLFPDCRLSEGGLFARYDQHELYVQLSDGAVREIELSYLPRVAENIIDRQH